MGRIEILRSRYVLQLLILSTRTHFQRVSEHYMVTRTYLWILSCHIAGAGARYTVQRYYVRSIRLWRRVLSTPREEVKI